MLDDDRHPCWQKCADVGIDASDGMIVLRRDIFANGKSVCRINGKLVTMAVLRDIGATLVDIHGQHEHQELMDPSRHLSLLDEFGGLEAAEALARYRAVYERYEELGNKLKNAERK